MGAPFRELSIHAGFHDHTVILGIGSGVADDALPLFISVVPAVVVSLTVIIIVARGGIPRSVKSWDFRRPFGIAE